MGRLKDAVDLMDGGLADAERIKELRQLSRNLSGRVVSLIATLKAIRIAAFNGDADDQQQFQTEVDNIVASTVSDLDAMDTPSKTIARNMINAIVSGVNW